MIHRHTAGVLLALLVALEASASCVDCHPGAAAVPALPPGVSALSGQGDAAGCILCHGGDAAAEDAQRAHQGVPYPRDKDLGPLAFYADPGAAATAKQTCGRCHTGYAERWAKSVMSTGADSIERGLCPRARELRRTRDGMPQRFGRYAITDDDSTAPNVGTPAYRHLMECQIAARPELYPPILREVPAHRTDKSAACRGCHNPPAGTPRPGCSTCHRAHTPDAGLHVVQTGGTGTRAGSASVPMERCFGCHFDPRATARNDIGDAVVHYGGYGLAHDRAGAALWCQDCHTSIEMHGDGNIAASADAQREVRCEDCHGTLNKLPWELPLVADLQADGQHAPRAARGLAESDGRRIDELQPGQTAYLLTSRGNPFGNVVRVGDSVTLHSISGRVYPVRLLAQLADQDAWGSERARQVKAAPGLHAGLECMDCHADWLPSCISCHAEAER
jgi:hypothetical protein